MFYTVDCDWDWFKLKFEGAFTLKYKRELSEHLPGQVVAQAGSLQKCVLLTVVEKLPQKLCKGRLQECLLETGQVFPLVALFAPQVELDLLKLRCLHLVLG